MNDTSKFMGPIDELESRLSNVNAMLQMMMGPGLDSFEECHRDAQDAYVGLCIENIIRARELTKELCDKSTQKGQD